MRYYGFEGTSIIKLNWKKSTRIATGLEKHPTSEARDCALVVTGAYDRQLRLWDVSETSVSTEERTKLLGTLSNKVTRRRCDGGTGHHFTALHW